MIPGGSEPAEAPVVGVGAAATGGATVGGVVGTVEATRVATVGATLGRVVAVAEATGATVSVGSAGAGVIVATPLLANRHDRPGNRADSRQPQPWPWARRRVAGHWAAGRMRQPQRTGSH